MTRRTRLIASLSLGALIPAALLAYGSVGADQGGAPGSGPASAGGTTVSTQGAMLSAMSGALRSVLYPANWLPVGEGGVKDADGRFLPDFSYAGYRSGDAAIPAGFNNGFQVNAVTQYGADNQYDPITNPNSADATNAIQAAINAVCSAGGGTVFLPAGAYRIKPQGTSTAALRLSCNNIILRGATGSGGLPATYLFNDEAVMRNKRVIFAGAVDDRFIWYTSQLTTPTPVTVAVNDPTRTITVGSTVGFEVGAPVVIRTDMTDAFKALHSMGPGQNGCSATLGCWWSGDAQGQLYYRTVRAILPNNGLLLDAPIRYLLLPGAGGNNPRVYRTSPATFNVGIENLYIGMRENLTPGYSDATVDTPGTGGYETSGAQAIRFAAIKDSWVRNVRSYRPRSNPNNFHLASLGIALSSSSRNISILNSYMGFPKNRLAGGNGYLVVVAGQDHLVRDTTAEAGRHNFQFTNLSASGNVILGGTTINSEGLNDFHVSLSHANLVDGQTVIGRGWQTVNRASTSNGAGTTGTQNVFWNLIKGDSTTNTLVQSAQYRHGYIIGSRGNAATVNVTGPSFQLPTDWVEALNAGSTLEPQSLYLDQKAKRDANPAY